MNEKILEIQKLCVELHNADFEIDFYIGLEEITINIGKASFHLNDLAMEELKVRLNLQSKFINRDLDAVIVLLQHIKKEVSETSGNESETKK